MRDRLTELLPLLLVAVILLVFQFSKGGGISLPFWPFAEPTPVADTPARTVTVDRRTPSPIIARATLTIALCDPTQPRFVGNIAMLRAALGSTMGDPVQCEAVVDSEGNTQQKTTTGLAYFRKSRGVAAFTTGWDHWALVSQRGLVHWASDAVDPPD